MGKITAVNIGDSGTAAKNKINEAIETVESNTTLTGDGTVATPLAVNPDLVVDSLQFTGGTGTQGTFSWNTDEETVDLIQNGTVLQLGQEIQDNTRNNSGVAIADGDAVMFTGTLGASGRITIAKMNNDGSINPFYFLGFATEAIANGDDGKVTNFGKIRGIQTNGANYGQIWADSEILYLNPSVLGGLTNVQPDAPSYKAPVAIVINAHATNGTIRAFVNGDLALGELADVQALSPTDGDLLQWNNANSRWQLVAVASLAQPEAIAIACSDLTTDLTTGTSKAYIRMPFAMTLTEVRASLLTAATGAIFQVDINEGGVSVLSTKLTIDIGEKTSTTAATPPVISDSALADDAEITIDIDTIGSTIAGAGLVVTLIGNR